VNKSKAEAVRMLRRSPRGSKIELLVRRAGDGGPTSQQVSAYCVFKFFSISLLVLSI